MLLPLDRKVLRCVKLSGVFVLSGCASKALRVKSPPLALAGRRPQFMHSIKGEGASRGPPISSLL